MGRTIEGFWDCPWCGKKHIRGLVRECPSCGAARGEDVTFYMDDPHNYIDEETVKKVGTNPDWLCMYCGGLNNDKLTICKSCGASRDGTKNYFQIKKDRPKKFNGLPITQNKQPNPYYHDDEEDNDGEYESSTDEKDDVSNNSSDNTENQVDEKEQKNNPFKDWLKSINWKKAGLISLGSILAIVLIIGIISIFTPKMHTVTVDGFYWERSIDVEKLTTVNESDWDLPSGGRLQRTAEEIRSYKDVFDHYETKTRQVAEQVLDHYETVVTGYTDNGNGTFSEKTEQRPVYRTEYRTETYEEPVYKSVPVYDTKYYYEIDKWLHEKYITTKGDDQSPEWGVYECEDKERLGSRSETYKIYVTDEKDKQDEYTLDLNEWKELKQGDKIKVKVHFGGKAEIIYDDDK